MRPFGIEASQGAPGDPAGSHGSPSRDICLLPPEPSEKPPVIPIIALSRDIYPISKIFMSFPSDIWMCLAFRSSD